MANAAGDLRWLPYLGGRSPARPPRAYISGSRSPGLAALFRMARATSYASLGSSIRLATIRTAMLDKVDGFWVEGASSPSVLRSLVLI
ncbi:hypothetical protein BD309DRAFT_991782 [Dichomitus squalens]|uniref:Uncharacterized protein n=1 Tax=Dichomitus squalens TaxID=114155 RepID=A0A4Q9NLK8_9APHY|nr:uncharacterized protein DICSQDRAFT_134139 [Dichomitus squalens LYAD-421 SS1]EJF63589.1 hypothetical protein DICSQDRAFT_134139 [Dichomitus squalens LYAD-421 SS1]TBU42290.1 hypothetical protein BD309DRAFT_991782 [Dichomitus squalens]TBU57466.1 hypothetical protein BD310DRAFT_821638 [Dichomitus squalens]